MLTWGSFDILLLSWFMPQMQGLELWAAKNLYSCPIELFVMRDVFCTCYPIQYPPAIRYYLKCG